MLRHSADRFLVFAEKKKERIDYMKDRNEKQKIQRKRNGSILKLYSKIKFEVANKLYILLENVNRGYL